MTTVLREYMKICEKSSIKPFVTSKDAACCIVGNVGATFLRSNNTVCFIIDSI